MNDGHDDTQPRAHSVVLYVFGALGGFLFGYDTGVISGAILFIADEFQLSPLWEGTVVSGILVGALVGAGSAGRLADRMGRRRVLLVAGGLFLIGALGAAGSTTAVMLVAFRIVLGLAVGTASVTVPLYLSELAPAAQRGRLSALNQLMITVGILTAYIVGYSLADAQAWRWMLGLGAVPAILLLFGMAAQPETPRWLVRSGRESDARDVLRRLRGTETVDEELSEIRRIDELDRERRGTLADLISPLVRPALIVAFGLATLQQFVGINTVIYYAPTTLTTLGFGDSAAILANVGIGVVNVALTLVALRLLDRLGRRVLLLAGNIGMATAMLVVGMANLLIADNSRLLGALTVGGLGVYIASFAATWGPTVWVMLPEVLPLHVRGIGVGVATMGNWGGNLIVALAFPSLLAAFGVGPMFLVFAGVSVLAFAFVARRVTETKGRSLEDIEAELRSRQGEHT